MSNNPQIHYADLDLYMRRARRLRSITASSLFAGIGRAILASIRRAYIRPYRMTRIPGCGCEA